MKRPDRQDAGQEQALRSDELDHVGRRLATLFALGRENGERDMRGRVRSSMLHGR